MRFPWREFLWCQSSFNMVAALAEQSNVISAFLQCKSAILAAVEIEHA